MEKGNMNIGTGGLLLIIIFVIIATSVSTILMYDKIKGKVVNADLSLSEDEYKASIQENKIATNVYENTEVQAPVTSGESKDDNVTKLSMPVTLNGTKHELVIERTLLGKKWEESSDIREQETKVSIDGKQYDKIEKSTVRFDSEMPEISKMKTKDGKEVIVMSVKQYYLGDYPVSGPETEIYVLDENGNNLGRIKDCGRTSVTLAESPENRLEPYSLADDYIEVVVINGAVTEIHNYTVKNGVLKDEITDKYTGDEWQGAGVKY